MKRCTTCGMDRPLTEFFKSGTYPSGKRKYRGNCKTCASKDTTEWREKNRAHYNSYMGDWRTKNPDKIRAIDMKRTYGITVEQYSEMLESQGGLCKICGKGPRGKRPLAIDHDHKTGHVRGILCYRCNQAISILDDKDHLEQALAYLKS